MNGATETKETAVENRTSDEFINFGLAINRQDLRALLSPAGTKRERQERLVAIAKRLGFETARDALWDEASPEWPIDSLQDEAENADVGEVCPVSLGVFLNATVYVASRWSDGCRGDAGGDVEYATFDTDAEAREWANALEVGAGEPDRT